MYFIKSEKAKPKYIGGIEISNQDEKKIKKTKKARKMKTI